MFRPDWAPNQRSSNICLPNAGIKAPWGPISFWRRVVWSMSSETERWPLRERSAAVRGSAGNSAFQDGQDVWCFRLRKLFCDKAAWPPQWGDASLEMGAKGLGDENKAKPNGGNTLDSLIQLIRANRRHRVEHLLPSQMPLRQRQSYF